MDGLKSSYREVTHNILYLNRVSEIGGAEISLLLLLTHLDKALFHPVVVLPCPGPLVDRLAKLGIETIIMPLNTLRWRNPLPYIRTVYGLARLIKNKKIDLVHSNIEYCNQYAVTAAKITRRPSICHVRNILPTNWNFWEYLLWFADVLIANSHGTAASFAPYVRRSQQKAVIYNGLELDRFVPQDGGKGAFHKQWGIKEDAFIIGVVARLVRAKGQHIFIRSMAEVVKACPNAYALVVGDATIDGNQWFLDELRQQTAELGLGDRVIFTGFVENMLDVYHSLDLVVLPSLAEPFGRALIEAMAMKKPVVATRAGGAVEVVEEGLTGLLVPPGDAVQLAAAILKLVENRELGRRLGESGRRRVELLFSVQENLEKTQTVYRCVSGASGGCRG